jgi:putative hydrolase of the HAD superfamily
MLDADKIRGVLFDYGGTIDSNGVHWAEVMWQAYQHENVPVTKELFREAYIHGERTLGKNPLIKPHHTFLDILRVKVDIQMGWIENGGSGGNRGSREKKSVTQLFSYSAIQQNRGNGEREHIADYCYGYARSSVERAHPVIEWIAGRYPVVLVSNFYGNLAAVLQDFGIDRFFPVIIESAVVGVRKPDPQIFRLGVEALRLREDEVVVIGDSYDKDIIPATAVGCQTIWLKNTGWSEYTGTETADLVISDFEELKINL